jgi:hypothetical protein
LRLQHCSIDPDRDGDYIARMLARVEGMPLAALEAGLDWNWRTFGEWLDRIDGRLAVNAGFPVGHSGPQGAAEHHPRIPPHLAAVLPAGIVVTAGGLEKAGWDLHGRTVATTSMRGSSGAGTWSRRIMIIC